MPFNLEKAPTSTTNVSSTVWLKWLERLSFFVRKGRIPAYTVSQLPSARESEACMAFVTDETGGPVAAYSDGSDWRRVTDGNVVSS